MLLILLFLDFCLFNFVIKVDEIMFLKILICLIFFFKLDVSLLVFFLWDCSFIEVIWLYLLSCLVVNRLLLNLLLLRVYSFLLKVFIGRLWYLFVVVNFFGFWLCEDLNFLCGDLCFKFMFVVFGIDVLRSIFFFEVRCCVDV